MSEAEIHTLETIKSDETATDSSVGMNVEEDARSVRSVRSCVIVSDNEDGVDKISHPNAVMPPVASASVSREEAIADVNIVSACEEGDLHLVEQLLTADNLNEGGLHHAAAHNHWRICKLLISRGADVNFKLQPLNATPMLWAARHGHAYIVKLLLDNGADPTVVDNSSFTLLHLAVHSSNVLMVTYVVHLEVNIDKPDVGFRTPLHWAIVQGDHLSVEVLLKSGASPNLKDGEGASPLHLATYVSQSELIVSLLLQHGADPQGCVIDMANPPKPWVLGCKISGRKLNGYTPKSRFMSPELAKVVTSVTPTIVIPFSLNFPRIFDSSLIGYPLALLLVWQTKRGLEKYVIPYCWLGDKAILQSTLIAGIFFALFSSLVYFWLTTIAVKLYSENLWTSLLILVLAIVILISYLATMFLDPGKIEPRSMAVRLKGMNDLLDKGLFDSVHLCVHTYVVIPARAKYDHYLERVICRYDHYCPWLYNAIGVRNHRAFVIFLVCLGVGIPVVAVQYAHYIHQYGSTSFGNAIFVLVFMQSIWIYVLLVVQLAQIARGATSYESSHMENLMLYKTDPIKAFSSLPKDHPKAQQVLGDSSMASSLLKHTNQASNHKHKNHYPLWMRITGLSQVGDAMKLLRRRRNVNRTDFGFSRNLLDFWCAGGNPFHPDGTKGLVGGIEVDYATLTDLPVHPSTEMDQILA